MQADAGMNTMTQGPYDLVRVLSEFRLYDFSRLAKTEFLDCIVQNLANKISSQIVAAVFPSWVFSGVSIPKNFGVSIGVIAIICFLSIYFPMYYL